MRVGESIGLDCKYFNLNQGLLTVRQAKFNKSRLVPIHFTTQKKLREYERLRNRRCAQPKSPSFFLSERGTRLNDFTVRRWFIIASRQIGLRAPTDRRGPRIHDLRHLYAFKTISNWYRRGMDVEAHLPELTTYILLALLLPANIQDRDGARQLLARFFGQPARPRVKHIWADGGYARALVDWARQVWRCTVEIVKRSDSHTFRVLPRRWVVERTFGWLGRCRRLNRDYERQAHTGEVMVYLAMIRLMLARLAKN